MSVDSKENKNQAEILTKKITTHENLLLPDRIPTIHADRIRVAVDNTTETTTMTLLTMHVIPKIQGNIDVDNYSYELSAEIKTSCVEMDFLAMYYLTTRTSNPNKLLNLIQEHLRDFPLDIKDYEGLIRFGPISAEPIIEDK